MGRLTLNMLLSFAQFEREVTGERIRDKIAASKAKGMWMGGRPPLGYDCADHKLQVNQAEATKVRAIFQRYLELGSVVKLSRELAHAGVRSKAWVSKSGRELGGHPFSRGAAYHLLANPVYRGAIRHGEKLYWGSHPPVVDEATWDAVQNSLAQNAPAAPITPKIGEGALLKGILFDDLGNAMQPIHTRRGDRRYHYYVASVRVHGDARDIGSLPRVGANTLDTAVIERTRMLLRRDWRPSEPIEVRVRAALRRVTLGAARIVILVLAGACQPDVDAATQADGELIEIELPIRLKHRQSAILITPDDQRLVRPSAPDRALVRAVCLAREWRRWLEAGEVATTRELARREGLCHRHTGRLLPLAYLSPDLVAKILEGRQPRAMSLQALTAKSLPRAWEEQKRLFASFG